MIEFILLTGVIDSSTINQWIGYLETSCPLYLHLYNLQGLEINETFSKSSSLLIQYAHFIERLQEFKYPIFCVSEGYILGGSMAWILSSDLHITVKNTKFKFPEVLINGLPSLVSACTKRKVLQAQYKAKLITGQTITSQEALTLGITDLSTENIEKGKNLLSLHGTQWSNQLPTLDVYSSTVLLSQFLHSKKENHTLDIDDVTQLTKFGIVKIHSSSSPDCNIGVIQMDYERLQNSMDKDFSNWFRNAVVFLKQQSNLRGVVLCHGPLTSHFCIGIDTRYFIPSCKTQPYYQTIYEMYSLVESYYLLQSLRCPILGILDGCVNGGGLALALQCDLLWCTPDTNVVLGILSKGVNPILQMGEILKQKIGPETLMELYLDENPKNVCWLKEKKIVQRCIEDTNENLITKALEYLTQAALRSPNQRAIEYSTQLFRKTFDQKILYKEVVWFVNCLYDGAFSGNRSDSSRNTL